MPDSGKQKRSEQDMSGYNGWANYPTWCVNLWIDNDQGMQAYALELAESAIDEHGRADCRGMLGDDLRSWIVDDVAPDLGASFAADLLGYALDQVDWREIADGFIEQIEPDEDEDEDEDA